MARQSGVADEWGQGRVLQWDAAKGLGFVQAEAGGERLLLRRADLCGRLRTRPPQAGEPVRFLAQGQGHARRAARVSTLLAPPGAAAASAPAPRSKGPDSARLLVIPAFAIVLGAIHMAWPLPRFVTLMYGALSMALFIVYGMDKWAARRGAARVRESALHLLALLGGWPGALLGQQIFRHKTAQPRFLRISWAMVVLNLLLLIAICTPVLTPWLS
ncbi:MAG: DUF1294 domain-containing protein [Inhella sp.]|jgi:uncharacterized membrane protein YsdA (DUF1294 family)/cold shock CspA family protein|nr:DUF1294 domain-containing protein [Inhella sp.]